MRNEKHVHTKCSSQCKCIYLSRLQNRVLALLYGVLYALFPQMNGKITESRSGELYYIIILYSRAFYAFLIG